jgi:hypothetical protein
LSGTVTDSQTSAPISGAVVSYIGPTSGSTTTYSNGQYTVSSLVPGSYTIAASMSNYNSQTQPANIASGGATTLNFLLQPLPGSITGRVTDSLNSNGISGATVSYVGPISGSITTDSNGYYTIQNTPEGSYQLTASMTGYITSSPTNSYVPPGGTATVNFQLQSSTYSLTFYTDPSTSGSITCGGYTYSNGQTGQYAVGSYSVTANAPTGYAFSVWMTSGGVSVSGSTATVSGPGSIKAVFVPSPPFSDGFEEGSIAVPPWSGQTSTGTVLVVQSSVEHQGSYALQVSGLGSTGDFGFAYYGLSGTEFTASAWYMFKDTLPTATGSYWILTPRFASTAGPAYLVADPIYNFATQRFGIRYWGTSGVVTVYESGTSPISANTWYQITLYIRSATVGVISLWINGSLKLTINPVTNTRTIGYICYGGNYVQSNEAADRTILIDDIQVYAGDVPPQ